MNVLSTEMMTSPRALKQVKNPLTLWRQALASAMEILAEIAGDSQSRVRSTCS